MGGRGEGEETAGERRGKGIGWREGHRVEGEA